MITLPDSILPCGRYSADSAYNRSPRTSGAGTGQGPAVVRLHNWAQTWYMWRNILSEAHLREYLRTYRHPGAMRAGFNLYIGPRRRTGKTTRP